MNYINREWELNTLRRRFDTGKPEFLIIYGRRRVGKSELIQNSLSELDGIRLLAHEESKKLQLDRFAKQLSVFFDDRFLASNSFNNWDAFFTYIFEKSRDRRLIIAIDEFPYLIKEDQSIPSILQHSWDNYGEKSKIFLIICGSSIGMMQDLMSGKSPLFGRRTGQILVQPLRFPHLTPYYLNHMRIESAIYYYAILGGIPAYVKQFDFGSTLRENIIFNLLSPDTYLFYDIRFTLIEEITEPRYYFAILRAISIGKRTSNGISNYTGLDYSLVGKYLSVLIDLHIINRKVPITENPNKSRKGIYEFRDNLFEFWFRFLNENENLVEEQRGELLYRDYIEPVLPEYMGKKFEDICMQIIPKLQSNYSKIGRWWYKEDEIDIVALDEANDRILFAECKWKENVNPKRILSKLKKKTSKVNWNNDNREEDFIIFARSFINKQEYCIDLDDIANLF